ncbi:hypothetical protein GT397_01135 [Enterococcus durans]|uniref:transposase n=1 Tax=Enterococcus durans TaxID=53345 RepID=UPI0013687BF4|nr:transposase [Enterococcus durans]MZH23778.1 hypothetical protein [Enterococcus durans]
MFKQPHQSIKTQCVRLSQLLQFQTTDHDSSWQNIFNQINRTERGFLLSVEDCLNREVSGLPETYTTTLRTFKKFLPQIQNALHYSYSNGPLECLNNHIKVLKRNAYGFRSFYNFKLRIMIRHGKTFLTK